MGHFTFLILGVFLSFTSSQFVPPVSDISASCCSRWFSNTAVCVCLLSLRHMPFGCLQLYMSFYCSIQKTVGQTCTHRQVPRKCQKCWERSEASYWCCGFNLALLHSLSPVNNSIKPLVQCRLAGMTSIDSLKDAKRVRPLFEWSFYFVTFNNYSFVTT